MRRRRFSVAVSTSYAIDSEDMQLEHFEMTYNHCNMRYTNGSVLNDCIQIFAQWKMPTCVCVCVCESE